MSDPGPSPVRRRRHARRGSVRGEAHDRPRRRSGLAPLFYRRRRSTCGYAAVTVWRRTLGARLRQELEAAHVPVAVAVEVVGRALREGPASEQRLTEDELARVDDVLVG